MRTIGAALFLGIFFNFVYEVLRQFGINNSEWFWYVGQKVEILLLFVALWQMKGRHPIINLGIYISIGALIKEILGIATEVNFYEYPIILGAYLFELYIYRKNDRN